MKEIIALAYDNSNQTTSLKKVLPLIMPSSTKTASYKTTYILLKFTCWSDLAEQMGSARLECVSVISWHWKEKSSSTINARFELQSMGMVNLWQGDGFFFLGGAVFWGSVFPKTASKRLLILTYLCFSTITCKVQ